MKIRVGIIFGGVSREREVSFAGGRTVYDNLNKSIFEPLPLFVDSFGNFILLDWKYIYKGSIRDFYPPVEILPSSPGNFQIYAESLGHLNHHQQGEIIKKIGKRLEGSDLKQMIDFAFLCLHGPYGEDGRLQGLFEYLNIPYTASGILPSAIGINKAAQKILMVNDEFLSPPYFSFRRTEWQDGKEREKIFDRAKKEVGIPFVVKAANQGSSIGVSAIFGNDFDAFGKAVNKSLFIYELEKEEWAGYNNAQKVSFIRTLTDIREGIGIPVTLQQSLSLTIFYHPEELLNYINTHFSTDPSPLSLQGTDSESDVIIEGFIEGKEFSCIVIQDENRNPVALPPTEIRKGKEVFDYRSKYLPGMSRKITPIDLPTQQIEAIRKECERMFRSLFFNVYARIDGFITAEGKIFLFDPNTISGMMPSSFFFHQAAEIGLNPSQYLTYIIRTSLAERIHDNKNYHYFPKLLQQLDEQIALSQSIGNKKIKIAVIMGGYSSERHISVESGRNIYEKLSSSAKYEPIPVFLTGNDQHHELHLIPINIMLKDNADDIREKVMNYQVHESVEHIIRQCSSITEKYSSVKNMARPRCISYNELAEMADGAFIALHGRPGEDGVVQTRLEAVGLPYNGSEAASSEITINKYKTNELLMKHGLHTAKHALADKKDWGKNKNSFVKNIISGFSFPFIVKPLDDGCSSAVKKIKNEAELMAYAELIFRTTADLPTEQVKILALKPKEEFPVKSSFLVEELITQKDASHFLEITGGILTHYNENGDITYEVFEPSETLAEGDILSLEEKFLAGQGQNLTPARYSKNAQQNASVSAKVKTELEKAAKALNIQGYARIDAFVRMYEKEKVEVVFIEVNSLPGMTPATCIFHQCALNGYKPYDFIDNILEFGFKRASKNHAPAVLQERKEIKK